MCCRIGIHSHTEKSALGFKTNSYCEQLLYDVSVKSDHILAAQSALLLTHGCPSLERDEDRSSTVWLRIAIQHAEAAGADQYSTGLPYLTSPRESKRHNTLKRIWWCCLIRDSIMSLCLRRKIEMRLTNISVVSDNLLNYEDLSGDIESSRVYTADTKRSLVNIVVTLAELCVCLKDVLGTVYPLRDIGASDAEAGSKMSKMIQVLRGALGRWSSKASRSFSSMTQSRGAVAGTGFLHDSIAMYQNLVWMFF